MDINNKNLENALTSNESPKTPVNEAEMPPQMSTEMEIGFHQGSLNTLAGERHALTEMIGHVESRMQAHSKRLEGLGVVVEKKE